MKNMKTKHIILALLSPLAFASCDYLDFDETSGLVTKENVYLYFNSTKQALTQVYSYMPQGYEAFTTLNTVNGEDFAMRDCASDDGEFGATGATVQYVNNGSWSAINTYDTAWELYEGIRAANSFLVEIENTDFTRYEEDGQYQNWIRQLRYFPYEARVLRAYYFFELARRYGDIAMPTTVLTAEQANTIEKTPFDDVISFIVDECDACISNNNLPDSYVNEPSSEVGRITRGFAMALKSKALLYAASPLHNPTGDTQRWRESAQAAWDIINSGLYTLDPNLVDASTGNDYTTILNSPEVVLFRSNSADSEFELYNYPLRFTNGNRSGTDIPYTNFPSQNLVDAFETVNGYAVTLEDNVGWVSDDPNFDPQAPYDNRDPRFYRTILANGMEFSGGQGGTIETYEGGSDYYSTIEAGGTPTGYFLRRYVNENTSFETGTVTSFQHVWMIYRYAETLLTYAESMVNLYNDPEATGDYGLSARTALNQVRTNAGMPEIPACSASEFIERLRNEWRVEFAFEDHRFWDVRRWQIGNETQRQLYGVRIVRSGNTYTYYKNLYETRTWADRMYLYPIPQEERFKNTNLTQNTGW